MARRPADYLTVELSRLQIEKYDTKSFLHRLSKITRREIQNQYSLQTHSLTTSELLQKLCALNVSPRVRLLVDAILNACDQAVYACVEYDNSSLDEIQNQVLTLADYFQNKSRHLAS